MALLTRRFEVTGFRVIVLSLAAAIGVWALLFCLRLQTPGDGSRRDTTFCYPPVGLTLGRHLHSIPLSGLKR
jgi:hypothetical protein